MLSNVELIPLLQRSSPIVENVNLNRLKEFPSSPVQPASIDLHVGEILVPPLHDGKAKNIVSRSDRYSIPVGGSAVLLTKERMNFPPEFGGLMFPKSSGLAERGILVTNFGHVDPGYSGSLRYAVINLSSEPYEVRVGDPISTLCVFRLSRSASPDWSEGRVTTGRRNRDFVLSLSPKLLSLQRITEEAGRVAHDTITRHSLTATLISSGFAVVIGVLSAAITVGLCWTNFIEPRMERIEAMQAAYRQVGGNSSMPDIELKSPASGSKVTQHP